MKDNSRNDELLTAVITGVMVAGFVVLRISLEPRFFYWDDVQHTFAPVFYTIGNALREGNWPSTTLLLWQGGFLSGEGIYQLFNPVSLAIFALLPGIEDISLGMALHSGVWLAIAGMGVHVLAARLGAKANWATIAGFSYATSPFLVYWLAASWVNGLVAFAALPWVLVFLATPRPAAVHLLALAFWTYIVGVSGWIHGMLAVALFGGARLLLRDDNLATRDRIAMACALASGALLASPQLLTTVAAVQGGVRPSNLSNLGRGVANLQGIVTSFWPAYAQPVSWFSGIRWSPPLYYAAWILLPACLLLAGRWRPFIREFRWLLVPALLLILATLGPEQLGTTRWPIRFLPAAWAAVIPLAATVISRYRTEGTRSQWRLVGIVLLLAGILTWQQHPDRELTLVVLACLIGFMTVLVLSPGRVMSLARQDLVCIAGTLAVAAWMAGEYPINTVFDDYHAPAKVGEIPPIGVHWPNSVVQIYRRVNGTAVARNRLQGHEDAPEVLSDTPYSAVESRWVPSGNIPLWRKERLVNGYTPIEMLSLKTLVCGQSIFGWTCDGPGPALLSTERRTQTSYADLMRIEAFVVSSRMKSSLDFFREQHDWRPESLSEYATVFRRARTSVPLQGTVSYLPGNVELTGVPVLKDDHETITLLRPQGFAGGLIAFARPYYPGYVAAIDDVAVPVERLGGVVIAVQLPPGPGPVTVEVRHRLLMPALWRACVLLGAGLLAAGLLLTRRPRPGSGLTSP